MRHMNNDIKIPVIFFVVALTLAGLIAASARLSAAGLIVLAVFQISIIVSMIMD